MKLLYRGPMFKSMMNLNTTMIMDSGGVQRSLFGGPSDNWQGGGEGRRVTFRDSFGTGGQGGDSQFQGGNNQYKWVANQQNTQHQNQGFPSSATAADLVNNLPAEMDEWEKSNMWPFSCLAIEKDLTSLPEFHDVSPEELRLDAYQAIKSGNIQPYTQKFQTLVNEFKNKRNQLRHMTMDVKRKLMALLEEARKKKLTQAGSAAASAPFGSSQPSQGLFGQSTHSTGSGLFGQSAGGASPSTFGSSSPISGGLFGSGSTSGTSGSTFGGNQGASLFGKPVGTGSVFGNQQQSPVGGQAASPFGLGSPSTPSGGTSLFGQSPAQGQPTGSLFGSGGSTTPAQSNPFGSATTPPSQGLFGKPATGFGQSPSTPSLFGSGGGTTGLFGSKSPPVYGIPQTQEQQTGSLFGKPIMGTPSATPSIFGNTNPTLTQQGPQQTPSAGGGGLFGKGTPVQGSGSLFGGPSVTAAASGPCNNPKLYTPLGDLTDQEKEAFTAKAFVLGKIPLRPPPKEMINL